MQVQHHVTDIFHWPRCKDVVVRDGKISLVLDYGRAYDLMAAYERAPHAEFLNTKDDRDLQKFVQTFGPLYLVNRRGYPFGFSRSDPPQPVTSTTDYWLFQRWLKALLQLIKHVKRAGPVREALKQFVDADFLLDKANHYRATKPVWLVLTSPDRTSLMRLQDWLLEASESEILRAAALAIQNSVDVKARLRVAVAGRKAEVAARFMMRSLGDALEWMCWQDEYRQNPLVFCAECGKAFRPETAHARVFCTYEHAHRAAVRNWRRNKERRRKTLAGRKVKR
jgi:hypothetical protein